jgi:RNA 2',3'-cyclic 3'-phosphodiesterase
MAKERLKSPRLRAFVALDLPDELREGIVAWGRRELRDAELRVVRPESLHVTLAFLGWTAEKDMARLGKIVAGLESPAPELRLSDPVGRPAGKRPRLFALPVSSPGTIALQVELQEKLVAASLYEPERRAFWPHVTLARVRSEERGSKRPAVVKQPPGGLPHRLLSPSTGVRVTLYRSELQPQGARYTPLAQVELSGGGRQ